MERQVINFEVDPNIRLYDHSTHAAIKLPKWRTFAEELPEDLAEIIIIKNGFPVHQYFIIDNLDSNNEYPQYGIFKHTYWTYEAELDLSPLLPEKP